MRKKPLIIFNDTTDSRGASYKDNTRQQNLLLKGMLLTSSFVSAANYAGIKRKVDLYRTWDRLTLRKDFHLALETEGVDMSFLVRGLKDQAENSLKDSVRLGAYQTFLKALGLDKYEVAEEKSQGWEEALKTLDKMPNPTLAAPKSAGYDVIIPKIPESAMEDLRKEEKLGKELYEDGT